LGENAFAPTKISVILSGAKELLRCTQGLPKLPFKTSLGLKELLLKLG
jgi:hypothetical protein